MLSLTAAGFGFAAGAAAAHYLLPGAWLLWCSAALALCGAAGFLILRGRRGACFAAACVFAALGMARYRAYDLRVMGAASSLAGTQGAVTLRVLEGAYRDGDYGYVEGALEQPGLPRLRVAVSDYSGAMPAFRAGDLAHVELEFIDAAERYGESTDRYASRGVNLRAYFISASGVERDGRSPFYFPQELASRLEEAIRGVFPEDVRALMLALLIGETRETYDDLELDNALTLTGTAHVISVSGMHLAFLYGLVAALAGRRRAALFGAPAAVIFTFMAGCQGAVVRACVMLLFEMAASLFERDTGRLDGLGAAMLVLLAANPVSVASVSLQLSFASMLGLILVTPALQKRLAKRFIPRGAGLRRARWTLVSSFSSSVGAMVFTLPILSRTFGCVSLISPLANLLTLWAASAGFSVGFAAAVLGLLASAGAPLLGFAATAAAWAAAWPARFFVRAIELLARIPFAALYTSDRTAAAWLAFTYAAFAAALLFGGKGLARFRVPAACSLLTLAVVFASARLERARDYSCTVLDVGQGECVVLAAGDSAAVVDCGGVGSWDDAGDTAVSFLMSRARSGIDALVLTHLHSDHANGAARLLTAVDVERLYLPAGADDSDAELAAILDAAERRGTEVVYVSEEDRSLELGELELTLLAPAPLESDNERGIVACASVGEWDAVITGDAGMRAERLLIERGALGRAELLVAGHHGSRYSSSFELVERLRPETVVISVGYNSYGHPTEDAIFRLSCLGAEVYRTDVNGQVTIRIDADG